MEYLYTVLKFNNVFYDLLDTINLSNGTRSLPNNCVINLRGGKFKNGTLNINGAKILPDYNSLLSSLDNAQVTGNPAIGTMYFQNGKPTWWNGTNWADALGNAISTSYITKSGTLVSGNVPEFDGTDGAVKDSGKAATNIP